MVYSSTFKRFEKTKNRANNKSLCHICFSAVSRKLGFLEVEGYDIFGKNELFAPRIKWEALKTVVEGIKNTASEYERGYNDIKESIESKSDFQQVDI